MEFLMKSVMLLTAVFLILLVLVQRGRGGGLAGALGGMGGQSAFGTKAGDLFTRITIGVASFWILMSCFAVWYFSNAADTFSSTLGSNAPQSQQTAPATKPGGSAPAKIGTEKSGTDKPGTASKPAESKPATSPAKEATDGKAAAPATAESNAAAPTGGNAAATTGGKAAVPAAGQPEPTKK